MAKTTFIFLFIILTSCNAIKLLTQEETEIDDSFYDGVCDYCNTGSDNSSTAYLNLTFPTQRRTKYVDDETIVRTVSLSYDTSSTLECSNDGGATFNVCSGSTYTWAVADYNVQHQIKATLDGDEIIQTFTPSSHLPGITFVSCSVNITANETVATFVGRTIFDGDVICINNGITIANAGSDGSIGWANPNVTMIVREGDTGTITSTQSNNILDDYGRSNTDYIGLTIQGTAASQAGLNITADNVDIEDVTISLTGNPVNALKVSNNGNNTNIRYSYTVSSDTAAGNAMYVQNSDITVLESTFQSGYQAVYLWKYGTSTYTLDATDSTFIGNKSDGPNGSSPGVIATFSNNASGSYDLNLSNSKVLSDGGPAILLSNAVGIVNLSLSSVALERQNITSYDGMAILVENMTGTNTISASTDSYICNDAMGSSNEFTSIYSDLSSLVTFDPTTMTAHTSNTDIGTCP